MAKKQKNWRMPDDETDKFKAEQGAQFDLLDEMRMGRGGWPPDWKSSAGKGKTGTMSTREARTIRTFDTGANRDLEDGKPDYEGILSPLVLEAYGEYMEFNRHLADGTTRDSDNWQKGMPLNVYMKSGWRHFFDWWRSHRGDGKPCIVFALCALLFNVQGYLHEKLKERPELLPKAINRAKGLRGDYDEED